jgi:hypothetical protein
LQDGKLTSNKAVIMVGSKLMQAVGIPSFIDGRRFDYLDESSKPDDISTLLQTIRA